MKSEENKKASVSRAEELFPSGRRSPFKDYITSL